MNKALNTVIYVVCSTIFLTLATLAVFFALAVPFLLISNSMSTSFLSDYRLFFLMFFFIASLLGGIFIYNAVLKLVIKKYDIEKYLLQRKARPKKPTDPGAR